MSDGSPAHTILTLQDGNTALIAAAQKGHLRAVGLLIAAKCKVDIQRKVRFTAYLFSNYLDVYRMGERHCTWPVSWVTVELLGCCLRPGLTQTSRLM